MKKIIALITALIMVLSLTGCFGTNNGGATADEAKAADISTYDKDFNGLVKYITDSNPNTAKQELYYDILGASDGARLVFGGNSFVEIYDFSKADSEKAKTILADVKDEGKFNPIEDGVMMTAVVTDSGKYVIAWDETRRYDYAGKVANDDVKSNW